MADDTKEKGTKPAEDAASVTEVPKGLDVAVTVPGSIVGSHDLQGTDGTERTDRPGEILGTPAESATNTRQQARAVEATRLDYVTTEVDRANREELPKLGGSFDSGWEPGSKADTKAAAAARTAQANAVGAQAQADAAAVNAAAAATPAIPAAPATAKDSGIKVASKVDKG